MVSGSGSCVFGICSSHADAERIASLAHDEQGLWSCATRVVSSRDEIAG
jgi:4-diphosphocytidyl-2-C-methyl-D-erythritol kinase